MINKKTGCIAIAAALSAISVNALAGGQTMMPMQQNDTGMTIGLNLATYGGSDYALMLGYVTPKFLVDLGASFENTEPNATASSHVYELRSDIGLRHAIMNSLYATGGALASYGFRSPSNTATRAEPYAAGVFVGLDYQPLEHFLLSFKLSPYTYIRDYTKTKHNDVFSDGSIQASYVFSV